MNITPHRQIKGDPRFKTRLWLKPGTSLFTVRVTGREGETTTVWMTEEEAKKYAPESYEEIVMRAKLFLSIKQEQQSLK